MHQALQLLALDDATRHDRVATAADDATWGLAVKLQASTAGQAVRSDETRRVPPSNP